MTKESAFIPETSSWSSLLTRNLAGRLVILIFLACLFEPAYQFSDDRYWLPLFSKYMALALFALSVDLIWGYTGLLSLGQGLYFGLGAYAIGYSLILQKAADVAGKPAVAAPDMALPDFMEYCRLPAVPAWIAPLIDLRLALVLAVLLPVLVATIFGGITFRLRVKGVYFSLVTQALVLAFFTLIVNQQPYTGGVVGMRGIAKLTLFGHKLQMMDLFLLTTTMLVLAFLVSLALMQCKFGKVLTAIRDNENRVLALGYDTAMYKTFVFAMAAAMAAIAGVLYVSSQGTAGPDRFGIEFSIEVVIMVAVGGRGTLVGPILGAILVNLANTMISDKYPGAWRFILGALFIGVVVFLPNGLVGGGRSVVDWVRRWRASREESKAKVALALSDALSAPSVHDPQPTPPPPLGIPAADLKGP